MCHAQGRKIQSGKEYKLTIKCHISDRRDITDKSDDSYNSKGSVYQYTFILQQRKYCQVELVTPAF